MVFKTTLLSLLAEWFETNPNTMERVGVLLTKEGIIKASRRGGAAEDLSAKEIVSILIFVMSAERRTANNLEILKQFYELEHSPSSMIKSICGVEVETNAKLVFGDFLATLLTEDCGKDVLCITINRSESKASIQWFDERMDDHTTEFTCPPPDFPNMKSHMGRKYVDDAIKITVELSRPAFLHLKEMHTGKEFPRY